MKRSTTQPSMYAACRGTLSDRNPERLKRVSAMDRVPADHDSDFYTWTREQADALRRASETRVNVPID